MSFFYPEDTGDMYDYLPGEYVYGDYLYVPEEYLDEKWWYIDDFPDYMISNKGRCWSVKKKIILTPKNGDKHGHKSYCLYNNGYHKDKYVHILVAKAFIPNPHNYPYVLHKNDIPDENWASNLKWGTQKENHEDCVANGNYKPFTDEVRELSAQKTRKPIIATSILTGEKRHFRGQSEAARILGLQQANIGKVLHGERAKTGGYFFEFEEVNNEEETIMRVVGLIKFDNRNICVYEDVNDPLFKLRDIASMIKYNGDFDELIDICEPDEIRQMNDDGIDTYFVDERGLYSILSQMRDSTARKWRRVIFNQLIELRKSKNMSIVEQFDEWDHALDDIYWDDERGCLMQSVVIPGGDVTQIPYEE